MTERIYRCHRCRVSIWTRPGKHFCSPECAELFAEETVAKCDPRPCPGCGFWQFVRVGLCDVCLLNEPRDA